MSWALGAEGQTPILEAREFLRLSCASCVPGAETPPPILGEIALGENLESLS